MLVPLYGFLDGDTMGVLVLAHADMTLEQVGAKLLEACRLRVDPLGGVGEVLAAGRPLPLERTVAAAGLAPLSRIDVRRRPA